MALVGLSVIGWVGSRIGSGRVWSRVDSDRVGSRIGSDGVGIRRWSTNSNSKHCAVGASKHSTRHNNTPFILDRVRSGSITAANPIATRASDKECVLDRG